MPRRRDGALVVFHARERLHRPRRFNAKKTNATIQVNEMTRAARLQKRVDRLNKPGQQMKVVLKKRVRRHLPILRLHAQHHLDAAFGRWIGPHLLDLPVQFRFRDFAFLDVLHKFVVVADETDDKPLLPAIPLAAHHDAIAVTVV